ncbi:MAG: Uma2 family endonuclease [Bryobacteraceae bacterium]
MPAIETTPLPLIEGERLTREEFLRRWEALANVKRAELIGGVVYLPSPTSVSHGASDNAANWFLAHYAIHTPGCEALANATWLMLEDAPQPDTVLRILREHGGQSRVEGKYAAGAPELVIEVSVTTKSSDFGAKLELYRQARVIEYLSVLMSERRVIWRRLSGDAFVAIEPLVDHVLAGRQLGGRLSGDAFVAIEPGPDGILRSVVFPGLWLDPNALLDRRLPRVLEVLDQGLKSPEHAAFVAELARRRVP